MILGMSIETFTQLHVWISLVGIATGFIVAYGLLTNNRMPAWTAVFLVTTIATSVTGFMFPLVKVGPPHIVGAISLVVLAFTLVALYVRKLSGSWRWVYASTAVLALYLNVFVLVVQAFLKVPFLHQFAPLGNEPPFAAAQGVTLLLFVWLGFAALKRFHPEAPAVTVPRAGAMPT